MVPLQPSLSLLVSYSRFLFYFLFCFILLKREVDKLKARVDWLGVELYYRIYCYCASGGW
jgi:hypothetical protein